MKIYITDTDISLLSGDTRFSLFKKPVFPDYSNGTARPYISCYFKEGVSIWSYLQANIELLADSCHDDPYFGCYTMIFRRLYPMLLSTSQVKNVIAYGSPADCSAYRVLQNFMTFLQEGNSLTALAQSPFSFTALRENSCHALIYRLDTCPAPAAVCDAMEKVKHGGLILLYTLQDALPDWIVPLCEKAEKDHFDACTVYALTMDESLAALASANGTEVFLLSRAEEIIKRTNDLHNPIQSMLAGAALPEDTYTIVALILQQTEEILLSIYDYLENDELPVLTNALKEAVLNYYIGLRGQHRSGIYGDKLTHASETFFAAIEREFQ